MPATDVAALRDRLDELSASVKEDFRSLGDDILKLQKTADQHTTALAELSEGQAELSRGQAELTKGLGEIGAGQSAINQRLDGYLTRLDGLELDSRKRADELGVHTDILDRHTDMLTQILDRLPPRTP